MIGIKADIKTKWKNYVIKADTEKARYHKVEYGVDNLNIIITATGLVPGKIYTFSARIRLKIQETQARKLFEFYGEFNRFKWYSTPNVDIAGKGDIDQFCSITFTPPPKKRKRQLRGELAFPACGRNGTTSLTRGTTSSSRM